MSSVSFGCFFCYHLQQKCSDDLMYPPASRRINSIFRIICSPLNALYGYGSNGDNRSNTTRSVSRARFTGLHFSGNRLSWPQRPISSYISRSAWGEVSQHHDIICPSERLHPGNRCQWTAISVAAETARVCSVLICVLCQVSRSPISNDVLLLLANRQCIAVIC